MLQFLVTGFLVNCYCQVRVFVVQISKENLSEVTFEVVEVCFNP